MRRENPRTLLKQTIKQLQLEALWNKHRCCVILIDEWDVEFSDVVVSEHCGLIVPEDEAWATLAVFIFEEGQSTLSACIVGTHLELNCVLKKLCNVVIGDVAGSAEVICVPFRPILADQELDVLTAEHRMDRPQVIFVVYITPVRVAAIVANSLFISIPKGGFWPERAAIVAGVFESICGAYEAGSRES